MRVCCCLDSRPVEGRGKGRETQERRLLVGFSNTQDLCGKSHLLCWLHRVLRVQMHTPSLPPGTRHRPCQTRPHSGGGAGSCRGGSEGPAGPAPIYWGEAAETSGLQPLSRPWVWPALQSSRRTRGRPSRPRRACCLPRLRLRRSICGGSPAPASPGEASQMEGFPPPGSAEQASGGLRPRGGSGWWQDSPPACPKNSPARSSPHAGAPANLAPRGGNRVTC